MMSFVNDRNPAGQEPCAAAASPVCISTICRLSISLILLLALLLCTCSKKTEIDFDSSEFDKFTTVYAEFLIGFEMAKHDSSAYFPIRDSILNENGVDTAWFGDYSRKLQDDPETWLKVYNEITKKLETKKDSLMP